MRSRRRLTTSYAGVLGGVLLTLGVCGPAWAQVQWAREGAAPPERRGVQVLPFVGVHSDLYAARVGFGWSDAGLLAGVIAGWRLGERASMNGQLAYHSTAYSDLDRLTRAESTSWDLTFCPLVHHAAGRFELVAGPKLGLYRAHVQGTDPTTPETIEETRTGFVLGGQAGAFMRAGPVGYGLLLSADLRTRHGFSPDFRVSSLGSRGVFSASLAVLF